MLARSGGAGNGRIVAFDQRSADETSSAGDLANVNYGIEGGGTGRRAGLLVELTSISDVKSTTDTAWTLWAREISRFPTQRG